MVKHVFHAFIAQRKGGKVEFDGGREGEAQGLQGGMECLGGGERIMVVVVAVVTMTILVRKTETKGSALADTSETGAGHCHSGNVSWVVEIGRNDQRKDLRKREFDAW